MIAYCTVLYYTMYYTILCYTILYYTVVYWSKTNKYITYTCKVYNIYACMYRSKHGSVSKCAAFAARGSRFDPISDFDVSFGALTE